jgi:hemoglobin-like flavoprotein
MGKIDQLWSSHHMNAAQIHLIRKTFASVERQADVAALVFYRRLFELDPRLRPLFTSDIQEQGKKLTDMLAAALSLLERPVELAGELEELGARHVNYGTRPEHYSTVRQALLDMLAEVLGDAFSPAVKQAWDELYDFIEAAMLRGAAAVQSESGSSVGARLYEPQRRPSVQTGPKTAPTTEDRKIRGRR